jgi:4-amino-4-deoxy-L-arabinose transferase-like glycosyltransferase
MNPQASTTDFQPGLKLLGGILTLIWIIFFSIALSGYPDLKNNEERVGGYVLDAVNNGNWMIQKDLTGDMASKPPMLTWLIGLTSLASGGLSRFSTYFPTALATLVISLVILAAGSKRMGRLAGFLGALCYLLSIPADFQMTTARYDGLFALPVLLAGLAAHRAWALGRGWTWFWLAAAAATLVKGPLGLLLGGAGLVAVFWALRSIS